MWMNFSTKGVKSLVNCIHISLKCLWIYSTCYNFTLNVTKFDLHFNGFTWHEMTLLVHYRFTCTHSMLCVHLNKSQWDFIHLHWCVYPKTYTHTTHCAKPCTSKTLVHIKVKLSVWGFSSYWTYLVRRWIRMQQG